MDDTVDKVRRAALEKAVATGSLEDIEKAASVAKALADAEKSASEIQNTRRQLSFQSITAVSSVLVPIVSLLALVSTIYIQGRQLNETQLQNRVQLEDTQWRDLLTSLRGSPDVFDADVTVAPRLRSFFNSARYGDQARDISLRLMGRLTNTAGFKELYNIAFPVLTPEALPKVLDVARALVATRAKVMSECNNLSARYQDELPSDAVYGFCTFGLPVTEFTKNFKSNFPTQALELRQAVKDLQDNVNFITSYHISPYLKSHYSLDNSEKRDEQSELNLSDLYIIGQDWSNLDLSRFYLERTGFDNVNLTNANLTMMKYYGIYFLASNWWEARNINQNLLDVLVEHQFPFFQNYRFEVVKAPSIDRYKARVAELCQPLRPVCRPENLKFGPLPREQSVK